MSRAQIQRLVSQLPYDAVPEMIAPQRTVLVNAPQGYARDLEMREDAPYFNASAYCNKLNLRFSLWLRHPATIALIQAFSTYYREAAHEKAPSLIMVVKSGARVVHGYYVHTMLHDALSSWCDFESLPRESRPRLPPSATVPGGGTVTSYIYTTQTVIEPGASVEAIEAAQAGSRARIAHVISAARGGSL